MTLGHATQRIGALCLLLLAAACALAAPAGAQPPRRAIVAFVPGASLAGLQRLPGASVALLNAAQGTYVRAQALLDVSQGARTSLSAYRPSRPPALRALPGGRVAGWPAAVRRARAAPAPVVPGLLAGAVPGGAAYVAGPGAPAVDGVAAADRAGRIAAAVVAPRPAAVAPAARRLLGSHRLVVAALPGPAALGALARDRPQGTLLIAIGQPPARLGARLLPVAVLGLGAGETLTSVTTRTHGLVTGIDVAPTVLRWLGRPLPADVTGEPMRRDGRLDVPALARLEARLRVVTVRRYGTLGWLGACWAVLAAAAALLRGRAGLRWAVRAGALAVLWVLPVLLAFAALAPSRLVEEGGVALSVLALGAATDRLVPWPFAPAVPGLLGAAAYVVDLALGSRLIVQSLLGPNPIYGSRFYGIGNELESTLPVLALCGVAAAAAALGRGGRSRGLAVAFGVAGLVLGGAVGAGRLGADVGGVITVGVGAAVAVLLALPGGVTRRRLAVVVLVPVAALAALAALDLATGGNGHFTRSVLRANDGAAVGDAVVRRYGLAWRSLRDGAMPLLTLLALGAIAWGIRRRDRLPGGVPGADAWRAGIAGSAAAGIAGSLSNDSGPMLLVFATFVTAWVAAYLCAGPRRVERDRAASAPGAAPARPSGVPTH